jgi:tetratricopeptide (TPR) repeat protein
MKLCHRNPLLLACWMAMCVAFPAGAEAQSHQEFDRGVAQFQAGDYASAAALFAQAESAAPGETDALLYEAKSLVHLKDFPGATSALNRYLSAHPDSADALYLLGFVLHRQNRPTESLQIYTKAAAHTAPTADDLKIVGLDYILLNDYADAIHWFEKAVELDAKNKDAWYYLGRAYYTRGRLAEARRAFATVLEIDPRDSKAENNLGLILETEGQPAAAIDAYHQAIAWQEQSPQISEQPYVNLGNLLMEQGQTKDAAGFLEKAVALAPDNAFCRMKLGVYYRETGQLENAQRELEKATALEPDNATAHYQLGRLYKEMHALDRAKKEFDRTAELQSRAAAPVPTTSGH